MHDKVTVFDEVTTGSQPTKKADFVTKIGYGGWKYPSTPGIVTLSITSVTPSVHDIVTIADEVSK